MEWCEGWDNRDMFDAFEQRVEILNMIKSRRKKLRFILCKI